MATGVSLIKPVSSSITTRQIKLERLYLTIFVRPASYFQRVVGTYPQLGAAYSGLCESCLNKHPNQGTPS
jgi:hypothetical protein